MRLFIYFLLGMGLSSCFELDDLLYNPKEVTGDYRLNNIQADELQIPATFLLDEDQILPFSLASKNAGGGSETIWAIYMGDTSLIKTDTVIVYCHGNAYNLDGYWERATLLANLGEKSRYGVLIMDYQGYGKSTGKGNEAGLYNDVDACLEWLKNKGLTGDRLVMYGFSMGTAPATELTANPRSLVPSKLILEAPFASAAMMVNDATPLALPASYLTNLKIDNAEEIVKVNQPFLWMHGEQDDFLSRKYHGQVVFDRYQGTFKQKVIAPNAGHGDFPQSLGFEEYMSSVFGFLVR